MGYEAHRPPAILVHVVLLQDFDLFAYSERNLIRVFRLEVVETVNILRHPFELVGVEVAFESSQDDDVGGLKQEGYYGIG